MSHTSADHFLGLSSLPGLSSAHIAAHHEVHTAYVRYADGGRSCCIQMAAGTTRRGPGGTRRPIYQFSRAAQKRFRHFLASINGNRINHDAISFVTLTYPSDFPRNPADWRRHLDRFRDRFQRRWGKLPVCWRLEFQERGAPHYHLLVLGDDPSEVSVQMLRAWCASTWAQCVASGDPAHDDAGTAVSAAQSWIGVSVYVSKPPVGPAPTFANEETGEILPIGRFWGRWGDFPIDQRVESLTEAQAFKMRRVLRRHLGWRAGSRRAGISCCVSEEIVHRVIEWVKV